ncbi:unnamed protein product [Acanthoscelides obtectus]|uniref:Uncharacterized protein n=1 Tax=Acanthoscelides obtectus TaxID=200917 RepID=A0A9P0P908_ACAOB|nr:unnamed protein product [Acanthoscelides obtectus]CAK1636052.1 hypothetical protein AOBTE_LOCUS9709 [Acanthoscelides obtectus]
MKRSLVFRMRKCTKEKKLKIEMRSHLHQQYLKPVQEVPMQVKLAKAARGLQTPLNWKLGKN